MFLPPTVTASTSGFSRAPWQTGQGRRLMYSSGALALLARVGLAVAPLEVRQDAFEGDRVGAAAAHPVAVLDVDLARRRCRRGRGSGAPPLWSLPRDLEVDLVAVGDRLHDRLVEARASRAPRGTGAPSPIEKGRVGGRAGRGHLLVRAEPGAARTGRRAAELKEEDVRGSSSGQAEPVVGAGEVLGEGRRTGAVEDVDHDEAVRELRRRLDRLRKTRAEVEP